jgi:NAD(P)H-dependent FMN reductase
MHKEYPVGSAPALLERFAEKVRAADAYVIVSREHNPTIPPPPLANLLDHFPEEYFYKPSAIVCHSAGAFGGVRAAIALRAMLGELGMSSIPSIFPIPRVQDAFREGGSPSDHNYERRIAPFLDELEWDSLALKAARERDQDRKRSECSAQQLVPSQR